MLNTLSAKARSERGLTLIELLVVMVIIGILFALLGRSYLPQIFRAQDTIARDQAKIVYENVRTCASDNEGIIGSYDDLNGANCFGGGKVENKVTIAPLADVGAVGNQGACWDGRITDGMVVGTDDELDALIVTPDTVNNTTAGVNTETTKQPTVFLCTYRNESSPGQASTSYDHAASQYYRISVTSNNTTYFFALSSTGLRICNLKVDDDAVPVDGATMRCRT